MWIKVGNELYDAHACNISLVKRGTGLDPAPFSLYLNPYGASLESGFTLLHDLSEERAGWVKSAIVACITGGMRICDLSEFLEEDYGDDLPF